MIQSKFIWWLGLQVFLFPWDSYPFLYLCIGLKICFKGCVLILCLQLYFQLNYWEAQISTAKFLGLFLGLCRFYTTWIKWAYLRWRKVAFSIWEIPSYCSPFSLLPIPVLGSAECICYRSLVHPFCVSIAL